MEDPGLQPIPLEELSDNEAFEVIDEPRLNEISEESEQERSTEEELDETQEESDDEDDIKSTFSEDESEDSDVEVLNTSKENREIAAENCESSYLEKLPDDKRHKMKKLKTVLLWLFEITVFLTICFFLGIFVLLFTFGAPDIQREFMESELEGNQIMTALKLREYRLKRLSDVIINNHYPRRMENFDRTNFWETTKIMDKFMDLFNEVDTIQLNNTQSICNFKIFEKFCRVDEKAYLYQRKIVDRFTETRQSVVKMRNFLDQTPALFHNSVIPINSRLLFTFEKGCFALELIVNRKKVIVDGIERNGAVWKLLNERQISYETVKNGQRFMFTAHIRAGKETLYTFTTNFDPKNHAKTTVKEWPQKNPTKIQDQIQKEKPRKTPETPKIKEKESPEKDILINFAHMDPMNYEISKLEHPFFSIVKRFLLRVHFSFFHICTIVVLLFALVLYIHLPKYVDKLIEEILIEAEAQILQQK